MNIIQIKAGETLYLVATYTDDNNTPFNLDNTTIASQLLVNNVRYDLTIDKFNQTEYTGVFSLTLSDDITKTFRNGKYACDIVYTTDGLKSTTDTFYFQVIQSITKEA